MLTMGNIRALFAPSPGIADATDTKPNRSMKRSFKAAQTMLHLVVAGMCRCA